MDSTDLEVSGNLKLRGQLQRGAQRRDQSQNALLVTTSTLSANRQWEGLVDIPLRRYPVALKRVMPSLERGHGLANARKGVFDKPSANVEAGRG